MKTLIQLYKRLNNQHKKFTQKKIAVIGYGRHATQNLYPILDYYNVPIKYIVTATERSANQISQTVAPTQGTTDLDTVLGDIEIDGIVICVAPQDHFQLIKRALQAKKHVFVEKPCGSNLNELTEISHLSQIKQKDVIIGLQQRYSPAIQYIKKQNKTPLHYSYSYQTGAYAEGDLFYDLWIHPLDLVVFLFGEATVLSALKKEYNKGCISLFLTLQHSNGCIGQIELSTNYTWRKASFNMLINDKHKVTQCSDFNRVKVSKKSPVIKGIPLEKFRHKSSHTTEYTDFTNPFIPTLVNNDLYLKGYYQELTHFLKVISNKKTRSVSNANAIINTYKLIEMITSITK